MAFLEYQGYMWTTRELHVNYTCSQYKVSFSSSTHGAVEGIATPAFSILIRQMLTKINIKNMLRSEIMSIAKSLNQAIFNSSQTKCDLKKNTYTIYVGIHNTIL